MISTKLIRFLVLALFLLLGTRHVQATDELAYSVGQIEATFDESISSEQAKMKGSKRMLSYRLSTIPSLMDLGVEFGTYSLSTENSAHELKLSSDYTNLFAGFYFWLYPKWLKFTLDLGFQSGVVRMHYDHPDMKPLCSENPNVSCANSSINDNPEIGGGGFFGEIGISATTSGPLFWGLSYEQQIFPKHLFSRPIKDHSQNDRITQTLDAIFPKSVYLTVGYRFGTAATNNPGLVPSGPRNTNDPCQLFRACD